MTEARILDRGYRAFEGTRAGVGSAVWSLTRHTTRSIMGLGRKARHKVFPVIVIVIAFLPAIAYMAISVLLGDFGDEVRPEYWELGSISVMPSLLFAALVAPESIVRDRRDGMLPLYLSTPLSKPTYLAAKVASVFGTLSIVLVGPPVFLLVAYTFQSQGPDGVLTWIWVAARLLVAGLAIGGVLTAVSLAASSVTDRRAFASVAVVLVLVGGLVVGGALVDGGDMSQYWRLVSPADTGLEIAPRLFGARGEEFSDVNTWPVVGATLAWIAAGAALIAARYRKLEAI